MAKKSKPAPLKESDLYAPVKALLEGRGYEVKAEVNDCDVVAIKDGAPPIVVELKLGFTLDLILQGVDRLALSDDVYLAIPAPDTAAKRRNWRARQKGNLKLCRRVGVGLMLIDFSRKTGPLVTVLVDPVPYAPRKNKREVTRLMTEFNARTGDPNTGGVTRTKIVTAYRQDALRLAAALAAQPDMKVAALKDQTGVVNTGSILQKNHYGWFQRTTRGIYALTDAGQEAMDVYADVVKTL